MKKITEITENIYRFTVPYKDIYTTVLIIKTPGGVVLFDTATYDEDVEGYIIPALAQLGITAEMLKYIVISHNHRDHAGGLERLMQKYPSACIVSRSEALGEKYCGYNVLVPEDGHVLLDVLCVVAIPGHTADCIGLLDTRSGTMLTGDSLQMYGIYGSGEWGANIRLPVEHLEALGKLRSLEIETFIASHDYHPCGCMACGRQEIDRYLDECAAALYKIKDTLCDHLQLDDAAVAERYNSLSKLPTIGVHVVTAIREAMNAGRI